MEQEEGRETNWYYLHISKQQQLWYYSDSCTSGLNATSWYETYHIIPLLGSNSSHLGSLVVRSAALMPQDIRRVLLLRPCVVRMDAKDTMGSSFS